MSKEVGKREVVKQIAERTHIPQKEVRLIVDTLIEVIVDNLKQGNSVNITGFGKFKLVERQARKVREPQSKKEIVIPARIVPTFKISKKLVDEVKIEK